MRKKLSVLEKQRCVAEKQISNSNYQPNCRKAKIIRKCQYGFTEKQTNRRALFLHAALRER
jgi:hypothetical protein